MATTLITGAGGFLGAWLCRVFLEAGHQVRAADLPGADLRAQQELGAEPVACDLADQAAVEATIEARDLLLQGMTPRQAQQAINVTPARLPSQAVAPGSAIPIVLLSLDR